MSPSVSLLPPPRTFPLPRYAGSIAACRVGDWEYPAFVAEWWGRREPQEFQPNAPDPFDPGTFNRSRPVWGFVRCQHPAISFHYGSCEVWKRAS